MLAFLNRAQADLGSAARRAAQDVVQTVHAVLSGGLHRLPDHVSDPQNFNIAQNDMISTYGLSMTQLGMIGPAFPSPTAWGKRLSRTMRTAKHQAIPAVYADPLRHLYARLQRQHGRGVR